ncbi:OmpP1/FadL family transporter [Pedosphaera parvula]|uniref:Membrane protein involved in aromatic hydrocarbon degradation n=1 Tax=Pedosphaera parvula (strain Ellin514) TaxID=320771 RepID=B9XKX3_PEDPL|nr:outer membrane protein transport protein [Pedosphaera parvula]EEF59467.1 membrane protein involved in aromatic hydrocarbon degradation [Pedosphaera parvula Ellin514]
MKLKSALLVSAAAVASPGMVFGLGIRIPDQDAFASSRGNAFVATADNPSAIYYNPAGISQLEDQNVRAGFYGIYLKDKYSGPTGSFDTKDKFQAVPQIYYSAHLKDTPLTLGLGVYSPYGLGLEWPDNTSFRTLATRGDLTYFSINPVLSWKVCDSFSIAAGPTINYGNVDLRRGFLPFPGNEFRFRGDDVTPGFTAGAMWKPIEELSFGASYRSQTTMGFHGTSSTAGGEPFVPSFTQPAGAEFKFPQNVVVGLSYRPTPDWNLEFDADWTDWNRLQTVNLQQQFSGTLPLVFNWASSWFYEFGATRYFGEGWRVSGGYIFSENSVPTATFSPAIPDSDRHVFSIGVGKTYSKFSWDASYQFAYGPTRTVTGSAPSFPFGQSADGKYEYISHALLVSLGYHF